MAKEAGRGAKTDALRGRGEALRGALIMRGEGLAALIDALADEAERFASMLEEAAARGDSERRLPIARREREIAAIGRRNAGRLRVGSGGDALESYPSLVVGDERGPVGDDRRRTLNIGRAAFGAHVAVQRQSAVTAH